MWHWTVAGRCHALQTRLLLSLLLLHQVLCVACHGMRAPWRRCTAENILKGSIARRVLSRRRIRRVSGVIIPILGAIVCHAQSRESIPDPRGSRRHSRIFPSDMGKDRFNRGCPKSSTVYSVCHGMDCGCVLEAIEVLECPGTQMCVQTQPQDGRR